MTSIELQGTQKHLAESHWAFFYLTYPGKKAMGNKNNKLID